MLYLFYGSDFRKARQQLARFSAQMREKKPRAVFAEAQGDEFSEEKCNELLSSQGLFESHVIVVFHSVLERKEAEEYVKKHIKQLTSSNNVFVFFESAISKGALSLFQKHANKVWGFNKVASSPATKIKKDEFNIFSLTDAIGKRDRKQSWIMLQRAYHSGELPERVHSILLWQVKNMAMVKSEEGKGQKALFGLGLNPFVLRKTVSFCKNYTKNELLVLLSKLVHMYHNVRRGRIELEVGIEKFVLKL